MRTPETLIKYAPADTAKLILTNQTLRWSSPALFAVPWELRADPCLPFNHLSINQAMLKTATAMIFTRDLPAGDLNHPLYKAIRRWRAEDRFHDEEEAFGALTELLSATAGTLEAKLQKLGCAWQNMIASVRVLAMSDTVKDPSSWRRYADNYRGVALKFDRRESGPLADPRQVEYGTVRPTLTTVREQVEDLVGLKRSQALETMQDKLLMKAKADASEREWRILRFGEDDGFDSAVDPSTWYVDDTFDSDDLRSVYFGSAISEQDQQEITALANERYSPVVFYRTQLSAEAYEMEFERI